MSSEKTPLWKQVIGAVAGAALAFAVYTIWDIAAPHLTAWTSIPPTTSDQPSRTAKVDVSEREYAHIAERARQIAAEFSDGPPVREQQEDPHAVYMEAKTVQPLPVRQISIEQEQVVEEVSIPEIPAVQNEEQIEQVPPQEQVLMHQEAEAEAVIQDTPALPSSGFGIWLCAIVALGAVAGLSEKRLRLLVLQHIRKI